MTMRRRLHARARSEHVERIERDGREYLRFPLVPLREMVYDYPEHGTREFLPAEHIHESVEAWRGVPIVPEHPDGSAHTPAVYAGEQIGAIYEPKPLDDGLRVHAYLDVEKARSVGGLAADVLERLENDETLATSPGYTTLEDKHQPGVHDGEPYDLTQGVPVPDHVAIFPDDAFLARCSPADGCAAPRLNYMDRADANTDETDTNSKSMTTSDIFQNEMNRAAALTAVTSEYDDDSEQVATTAAQFVETGVDTSRALDLGILQLAVKAGWSPTATTAESDDGAGSRENYGNGGCGCGGASQHQHQRTNYGARPGQVDRRSAEPESDIDDYPAAGRRAYERRQQDGAGSSESQSRSQSTATTGSSGLRMNAVDRAQAAVGNGQQRREATRQRRNANPALDTDKPATERERLERKAETGTLRVQERRRLKRLRTTGTDTPPRA